MTDNETFCFSMSGVKIIHYRVKPRKKDRHNHFRHDLVTFDASGVLHCCVYCVVYLYAISDSMTGRRTTTESTTSDTV